MFALAVLLQSTSVASKADAWEVFTNVCMRGGASLNASAVRASFASEMPSGAKHALGNNLINTALLASVGLSNLIFSADDAIPNKVFSFRDAEGFLVLPAESKEKKNSFAAMCAVTMRGSKYLAALEQISPRDATKLAAKVAKKKGSIKFSDYRVRSGRHEVSLVEVDGWTSAAVNVVK